MTWGPVDEAIEAARLEQPFVGLAIAISRGGIVEHARAFGAMRLGADAPVTTASSFAIASVSKTFTAATAMSLGESGALDLDASIARMLPRFALADERAKRITPRHLLSHTSGLGDYDLFRGWNVARDDDGALDTYASHVRETTLLFEPGDRFSYSNLGIDILGDLLEHVSGQSFESLVHDRMLAPLGLRDSEMFPGRTRRANDVTAHTIDARGSLVVTETPYHESHAPSGWTQRSTVLDLVAWARAFRADGSPRILSNESIGAMTTPNATTSHTLGNRMGLGWLLDDRRSQRLGVVHVHGGFDIGTRAQIAYVPAMDLACAVLGNYQWTPVVPITEMILDIADGRAPRPLHVPREHAASFVGAYRSKHGIAFETRLENGDLWLDEAKHSRRMVSTKSTMFLSPIGDGDDIVMLDRDELTGAIVVK